MNRSKHSFIKPQPPACAGAVCSRVLSGWGENWQLLISGSAGRRWIVCFQLRRAEQEVQGNLNLQYDDLPALTCGHKLRLVTERVRSWMSFLQIVSGLSFSDRVMSSVIEEGAQ